MQTTNLILQCYLFLLTSVADAENPTGFGIAAGINSHTDASRVSTESLYPVGSATKLYTAVAVLQAHERGLIDLDAPVAPVIDPFLQRTNGTTLFQLWQNDLINKVTARQLMGMRSGISDYDDQALNKFSLDANNWNEDITPYDYIHRWAIKKFLFAPGTGGAYTSIGYELLGFLLAAVNNVTTWQSYDQKSIFPAELRSKLPHMIFAGPGTQKHRFYECKKNDFRKSALDQQRLNFNTFWDQK